MYTLRRILSAKSARLAEQTRHINTREGLNIKNCGSVKSATKGTWVPGSVEPSPPPFQYRID